MLANPEAAGKLIETQFPQLGLKAAPMTASLKNITWKFTSAADARKDTDTFLAQLATLVRRRSSAARCRTPASTTRPRWSE